VASAPPAAVAGFAISPPGLELIVAAELTALGLAPRVEPGGVGWTGSLDSIARANLWLRTATRVVVRVAEFRARTFWELERHARKLPWTKFVAPGTPVRFRVTSRKSRLYHTDAIAQRLVTAAVDGVGAVVDHRGSKNDGPAGTPDDGDVYDDDGDTGAQLFVVRVVRDVCTVSADTSGELLHRRGYRQAVAKAPLRETLAAAMLLGSEWPANVPLIDPMCGSGTIAIEAALLARRIAPGSARVFAFHRWPEFDAPGWDRMIAEARRNELPVSPVVVRASDRDAGAVAAARANANRAGVGSDVEIERRPLSAIEPCNGRGWVVTNPPYGIRVAEADSVRDLYAALGNALRARFGGWRLALLSPADALDRQVGLALHERFATSNGGIPVRLVTGEVPV
jgi:putative N6-adenine-specific DNA methylase